MPTIYTYTITEWADDGNTVIESQVSMQNMKYLPLTASASDPEEPDTGFGMYWNTDDNEVRVWNGSTWRALAWKLL